ncbi:hypothetical protein KAF25_011214 [Fusarium avenaceum]|uniref:Aminoglycoside phosphotransferase domain-containing protein n=1 Tax=Fusarium avenaceum TaxID=40199 RepID=A0A9P7KQF5_9HYPO|nr:hypothetical protein KAF25_011214 [Fusarium avenaceum]
MKASRKSPSQKQYDKSAESISGSLTGRPVDSPGSMSYTVVCRGRPEPEQDLVISFGESEAMLDEEIVKLAKQIHGNLVPEYFARCWSRSLPFDHKIQAEKQEGIRKRFARLVDASPSSSLSTSMLSKLVENLPLFFSQNYPQVPTHNDFSVTNILLDENEFDITGIVDWSLATVMPFGMDLDILFLTTGFMTRDGWHDYACKTVLLYTFWKDFWTVSEIEEERRGRIQSLAEAAGRIGAILRLAFRRNADGSPSEKVLVSKSRMKQLGACFGDQVL